MKKNTTNIKNPMKYLKITLSIMLLFISILMISCPYFPPISTDNASEKNETYKLSDLNSSLLTIKNTDTSIETNVTGTQPQYSITQLPYISESDSSPALNLTLNLDTETQLSLSNKGFFLVNAHLSSTSANIEELVTSKTTKNIADDEFLHTFFSSTYNPKQNTIIRTSHVDLLNQPFTLQQPKKYKSYLQLAATSAGETTYFNDLTEYPSNDISTRTFILNANAHDSREAISKTCNTTGRKETELYKKINFTYKGKDVRFAFWVEKSFATTADKKNKIKEIITEFTNLLEPKKPNDNKSIYEILYSLHGQHVWDDHGLNSITAPKNAVFHIVFGDLGNNNIEGFVNPRVFFDKGALTGSLCTEERPGPTVYMNSYWIQEALNSNGNRSNKLNLFITLLHELNHAVIAYTRMIKPAGSSISGIYNRLPEAWLNELLSVSLEYMTSYIISESVYPGEAQLAYKEYFINFYLSLGASFPSVLQNTHLIKSSQFDGYTVAFLFSNYLVTNYGMETLQKLQRSQKTGLDSLWEAVSNNTKFRNIPSNIRPKNAQELLLNFFTALFTSDVIQPDTSPYGMFTKENTSLDLDGFQNVPDKDIIYANIKTTNFSNIAYKIPTINVSTTPALDSNRFYPKNTIVPISPTLTDASGNTIIDLSNNWKNGRGPYIFPARSKIDSKSNETTLKKQGQMSVIYLGGKIKNAKGTARANGANLNVGFHIPQNITDPLTLKIRLPKGTLAKLVIVDLDP